MSDEVENEVLNCELCGEEIKEEQPQVIIAAESHQKIGDEIVSLGGDRVAVFASFHSSCLIETMDDEECDEVPYIWEARTFLGSSDLCSECAEHIPFSDEDEAETDKPRSRSRHLSLIKGGLD